MVRFSHLYIPIHLFFVAVYSNTSELQFKCLSGQLPLLDETRSLFSCQRRCPDTFFCENQPKISMCCPNNTAIAAAATAAQQVDLLRGKKDIQFQLESSAELLRTMSCERFPYKAICTSNNTNTPSQPLAKWYFDIQTLSCELYPLGMCEEDSLEESALRTREECEERCDVAKVKVALEKLAEGSNSVKSGEEVFHFSRFPTPQAPDQQIAIDDVAQESKHIRGRPFAIEPPTDLLHVIHVPSDSHVFRRNQKKLQESSKVSETPDVPEDQLLTTEFSNSSEEATESEDLPTVTSDILTVLEDINDDGDILEGSGSDGRITVTVESRKVVEDTGNPENPENIHEEPGILTNNEIVRSEKFQRETKLNLNSNLEENNVEQRFLQRNKELVICTQTPYKLLCDSGKPTQFVYRWEKVNGKCQSFPYGYCWQEKNIAHPRTQAECEQYCP